MGQRKVLLFKINNTDDYNNFKMKFNKGNQIVDEFLTTKEKNIYFIYLKLQNKIREKEINKLIGYFKKYLIDDKEISRNKKKKYIKDKGILIDKYTKKNS
jgi:RecJ-like exonuclease